jgi:AcrR family transcriptional regulator
MVKVAKDEKRRRILLAAEELLGTRRVHEVKLDDVAEKAGVGKGTIYLYFKDKDDLIFNVATAGFDELCELVQGLGAEGVDFRRRLEEVCRETSVFFRNRVAAVRMMQGEQQPLSCFPPALRQLWISRRRRLVEAVGKIIEQGQEGGEVRSDVPPEILADFLLGMLRTRSRDLAQAPAAYREDRFVVDLFLQGAGAAPGRRQAGVIS